jgi:hypothetical protein
MIQSSLFADNVSFPERKSIIKSDTHLNNIVEEVKKIDVNKVNFEGETFQPLSSIIQKQKVFFWIRLYIKEELDIKPETKVVIDYNNGMEQLDTHFMYFGKKGLERDRNGEIVNFNPEDDKKVLCLMIDAEKVDINNSDIPYIKTLFPLGRHFKPQYIKKFDFEFLYNGEFPIPFYDINF